MNERKMYRLPINVEYKHQNKDFERRIYLSSMRSQKKKRKIRKAIRKAKLLTVEILLAFIPTFIVSLWAIPAAFNQRGYYAVGGEWILILLVFGFSFVLVSDIIDDWIEKERRQIRCQYAQTVGKESDS